MEKTKKLAKRIVCILFSLVVLVGVVPITAYALPGDGGNQVTSSYTDKFAVDFDLDANIFLYITPNAGDVYRVRDAGYGKSYSVTYDASQWHFAGWKTWFKGGLAGTNTIDKENPKFDGEDNYYFVTEKETLYVFKEWGYGGTYYGYAIFNPIVTVNAGNGISYSFTGGSSLGNHKYGATYGKGATVNYSITDSKYIVSGTGVTGANYSTQSGKVILDSIERAINVNINTRLKQQKVIFDSNNGSGTMDTQTFSYGQSQNLTANRFSRAGYEFAGWNTKADGNGTAYVDKQSVSFSPVIDGDGITLYAQWSKLPAAVASTAPIANVLTYTGEAQTLVSQGTTNDGTMMYSLEENGVYSETIPMATNADDYTVYYYVKGDNSHSDSAVQSVDVTIERAVPTADKFIYTAPDNLTYDGSDKKASVSVKEDVTGMGGITVKYYQDEALSEQVSGTPKSAGKYYVAIDVADNGINYKGVNNFYIASFEIQKGTANMTAPSAKELIYNGKAQELVTAGTSPTGTAMYYSLDNQNWSTVIPTATNADTYDVYYKVDGGENYKDVSAQKLSVVIEQKMITQADLTMGKNPTYTGQSLSANYTVTSGITYNVSGDKAITVGDYELSVTGTGNYKGTVKKAWKVLPADAIVSTSPIAKNLVYNMQAQELVLAGKSNDGTLMYSLEKNGSYTTSAPSATNADSYTVWYYVKGDGNHNDSEKSYVEVKIKKADPVIGTVSAGVVNDSTALSAIVLDRTNKTVEGSLGVEDGQILKLGENEVAYTFTPNDTQNYNVLRGKVKVTVKDTIAPVGQVEIGTNKWMEFLQHISFELFFHETQTVSVTANDNLSGVAKIEYYESSEALDITAIQVLKDEKWSEMNNGEVNVTVEDAKQFIYYIRVTDNSGNVSYLSTDGAEFDTTAPVIEGVYDGQTYYTSQKFEVGDKNLDTVTVNNEPCTDYVLAATDTETTYTIVATDKAGNTTTVTVTMKNLADITDVNSENVTPEDKIALEDMKAELEKDLEENGDIYSDEEKTAIDEKIKDIDDALEVIDNVQQVEEKIEKLPSAISKNDADAVKEADDAYNALTEYEKSLVAPELKKKLDDAKTILEKLNKAVNTGDRSNVWIWSVHMSVSLGCILGIGIHGKMRKEEN